MKNIHIRATRIVIQNQILKYYRTVLMKFLLLWQISNNPIYITMKAIRTGLVSKLKPSAVRVYDYYEPGKWNLGNIFIKKHYIM